MCGQKEKHKEYREERKRLQTKIKNLKDDISNLKLEKEQSNAFAEKNDASFVKVVRERLRRTDPTKYSNPSKLMADIIALKTAYNGLIPSASQNDKLEFAKHLSKLNNEIKREFRFKREKTSESDSETEDANVVRRDLKKVCTDHNTSTLSRNVHVDQPVPPMFNQFMPNQCFFPTAYVMPQFVQPYENTTGFNQPNGFLYSAYGVPSQQPFPFYAPGTVTSEVRNKDTPNSSESKETTPSKPKIWSPFLE